jgi:TRAP-type C4-dicarboxylate transport system permease small subunit
VSRAGIADVSGGRVVDRSIAWVVRALAGVAGATLLLMLLLTVGNMGLRAFATPYFGTFELVALMAVVVSGLSLGEAQRHQTHVAIDIVTSRLPMSVQQVVGVVVALVATALFGLVAWQLVRYGWNLKAHGAVTESLRIPYWPVVLVLAGGFVGLVLALLSDVMAGARGLRRTCPEEVW